MAKTSTISWTDQTWNMIHAINLKTGKRGWHCEHVTEACRNCYAETLNMRAGDSGGTGLAYKPGHRKDLDIFLNEDALLKPLHWRSPRKIFVCSMTDLFADFVPDEWLDRIFAIMALCPQHQFQVLTKRPARMRAYLSADPTQLDARIFAAANDVAPDRAPDCAGGMPPFPLPNVWLGTSICDQADADKFIPELLAAPAAIRFLSCEPLLGPINLRRIQTNGGWYDSLVGWRDVRESPAPEGQIDWVIIGGESGKEARAMLPSWARSLREQCAEETVPFHFKQWGEWAPVTEKSEGFENSKGSVDIAVDLARTPRFIQPFFERNYSVVMGRFGARAAGRLLDGTEHNALPVTA